MLAEVIYRLDQNQRIDKGLLSTVDQLRGIAKKLRIAIGSTESQIKEIQIKLDEIELEFQRLQLEIKMVEAVVQQGVIDYTEAVEEVKEQISKGQAENYIEQLNQSDEATRSLKIEIKEYHRNLLKAKEKRARYGIDAPGHLELQIEDLENSIENLGDKLNAIQTNQ